MTDEKRGNERVMLTTDQVVAALDVRNRVAGVIQEEGAVLSSSAREAAEALIRLGYLDVYQVAKREGV
jgi:hypothetical protein